MGYDVNGQYYPDEGEGSIYFSSPEELATSAERARQEAVERDALNAKGQYIKWQGFCLPITIRLHWQNQVLLRRWGKDKYGHWEERKYDLPCIRMHTEEQFSVGNGRTEVGPDYVHFSWQSEQEAWVEEQEALAALEQLSENAWLVLGAKRTY